MAVILNITRRCCFCNQLLPAGDSGNSPEPLKSNGVCCNKCNLTYVLAAKLLLANHPDAEADEQLAIIESVNNCIREDMRDREHETIT